MYPQYAKVAPANFQQHDSKMSEGVPQSSMCYDIWREFTGQIL